jgi:hypothetical protein
MGRRLSPDQSQKINRLSTGQVLAKDRERRQAPERLRFHHDPLGVCQLASGLVEATLRVGHCLPGLLHVPARDQSVGMKGPVSLSGFCGSDDRLFLPG